MKYTDWLQSVLYGVRRHDHVTPLLQQHHGLSVPEHIKFKLCILVYRCLHGLSPEYFSRGLQVHVQDSFSPETAFGLQYRCYGSCYTPVFTWRLCISGCRSLGMERITAQCHLHAISLFIPATSENFLFQ